MHYHVDMPVVKHEEAGLRKTEAGCTFMYTPCCVGWRNVATVGKQLHAHRINSWHLNIAIVECTILTLTNVTVTVHTNHTIKVP